MKRLYLVRHGENLANLTKEFSCRLVDYHLTPKGRLQAQQTAAYFRDKQIHAIYASPLKRALETAQIIAQQLGLAVQVSENFREVNVGRFERLPASAETWRQHNLIIEEWLKGKPQVSFPDGENYLELCSRMQAGVKQILKLKFDQNVIIVGHGGIFNFTLPALCPGLDVQPYMQMANHNCSISQLLAWDGDGGLRCEVVQWASFEHLHGEAAQLVPGTPAPGELD